MKLTYCTNVRKKIAYLSSNGAFTVLANANIQVSYEQTCNMGVATVKTKSLEAKTTCNTELNTTNTSYYK